MSIARYGMMVIVLGMGTAQAQPPIPSKWEGKAIGHIRGIEFSVPIVVEITQALPHEQNPFHLFVGSTSTANVGDIIMMSAMQVSTGGGSEYKTGSAMGVYTERKRLHADQRPMPGGALLQYLTVTQEGPLVTGVLTNVNMEAAAAVNAFIGPNVSAQEASSLMRGVLESLGTTENFVFLTGATLRLQFEGSVLNGIVDGKGRSVLNTSSDVAYVCRFQAKRTK